MDIHFHLDKELKAGEVDITVTANQKSAEVAKIIDYLQNYQAEIPNVIPIKTADKVLLVKTQDIILVDISGTQLFVYTPQRVISTTGRLYAFYARLKNMNFIQVSKHAILNVDHLISLEDSFAGGMTAILTGKLKTSVSRKYLSDLEQKLGL
ncbi:LytTR family DNA-binding domain-containing protein [Lentilactobacillus farraginis]|nr:LytTR family DNA-binding domain-containing protein [Lentilactobacillus farraginis]